jgi:hypothetical protein
VAGLPLRVKIFSMAFALSARAARPYTVSVGSTAKFPLRIERTQSSTEEKECFPAADRFTKKVACGAIS